MTTDPGLLSTLSEDLTDLAEKVAAAHRDAVEVRRRCARSLRDELLDLVARDVTVTVDCADGSGRKGTITGVGVDHVRLRDEGGERVWIALFHVVAVTPAGDRGEGEAPVAAPPQRAAR